MKNLLSLLLLAAAVTGGGWLIYYGPYYRDYYTMQEVSQSVVLTWAAFNKQRAVSEVDDQLKEREIDYITPEHCELHEGAGELIVTCRWQVDIYPPLIGGRRLSFETEAAATKDGRLVTD